MTIYRGSGGTGEARTDTDITEVREIMMEAKGYRNEAQAAAAAAVIDSDAAEAAAAAAAVSEANAATSEDNSATSETNAAASAYEALVSATNAASSATDAAASEASATTSASSATASASFASASASAAADSETAAALSETNAAASEAAAATSETNAATSESNAYASETAAAASEANAAASAASAAASWDYLDDRFLGGKSSDPTTDNDGNALVEGALYWSIPAAEFRAWSGSAWIGFGGLPSQDGASGQYLKSDGSNAAWSAITVDEVVPDQTGNSGKFLTTDGSNASWENVPDPQPATPTDDGLVYGFTPTGDTSVLGGWAPFTSNHVRFGGNAFSWFYIATGGWNGWVTGNVKVGDSCYVTKDGVRLYYGTVTYIGINAQPGWFANYFNVTNPEGHPSFTDGTTITFDSPLVVEGGNVSLGYLSNEEGANNTSIGYEAGNTITTGTNLTVIGYGAQPSSATATNEVTLGNTDVTKTRLFGALAINDQVGISGQVLTSNGTSAPTWQTPATVTVTSVNGETGAVVLDAADVGAATTAQGVLADSAVQPGDNISTLTNDAGYITGYTETDPIYVASSWYTTTNNSGNWDTAYGWGNHASVGYAVYPSQTSNAGKYLTTDGTNVSWAAVDALPDQTGNSGKYLTTDGSAASWAVLDTDANTTTKGLYEMANTISTTYAITAGNNAMSAGPITVTGSVTVPSGSVWTIV